jgi:NAD(P)-dependent dehydrogenase (short-subunit alcohol dehydrogenase family)
MTTTQFSFDDINGKIVIITGGAGVLCGAFALALAGVGAKNALLDINKNAAQKVAEDVAKLSGAQIIGIACDVLSKKSLEAARIQINAKFGPIDILVNGAGGNAK